MLFSILYPFGIDISTEPEKPPLKVNVRWLIRRDMPEVLDIERVCFKFAWTEEDFLYCLRQRNCIGMVAEYNHCIMGFMIYELHKDKVHILNFVVSPAFRRIDIGTSMIEKIVKKLSKLGRQEIIVVVGESNLPAQLFFKKMSFKAVLVLRGHYDDADEDAYVFRFSLNDNHTAGTLPFDIPFVKKSLNQFHPVNRISKYDIT